MKYILVKSLKLKSCEGCIFDVNDECKYHCDGVKMRCDYNTIYIEEKTEDEK